MPSELAVHWTLDPAVTFLNHGSFGATPRAVLEAAGRLASSGWSASRSPSSPATLSRRSTTLARHLEGSSAPTRMTSLRHERDDGHQHRRAQPAARRPDDELVLLDHAYPAARNTLQAAADAAGARLVTARVPFPGVTPEAARDAVMAAVGPRTRLVMLDHVTSPTALVLPVAEIVAALDDRGIETLVDGAHAPGMVDVDLAAIGATYTSATATNGCALRRAARSFTSDAIARSGCGRSSSAMARPRREPIEADSGSSTTGPGRSIQRRG